MFRAPHIIMIHQFIRQCKLMVFMYQAYFCLSFLLFSVTFFPMLWELLRSTVLAAFKYTIQYC